MLETEITHRIDAIFFSLFLYFFRFFFSLVIVFFRAMVTEIVFEIRGFSKEWGFIELKGTKLMCRIDFIIKWIVLKWNVLVIVFIRLLFGTWRGFQFPFIRKFIVLYYFALFDGVRNRQGLFFFQIKVITGYFNDGFLFERFFLIESKLFIDWCYWKRFGNFLYFFIVKIALI